VIVFELICPDQHRFEGWFASSEDFESQKARGLLECPSCGRASIQKLPTAKIGKSESAALAVREPEAAPATKPARVQGQQHAVGMPTPEQVRKIVDYLLANSENVGKKFAEEARRIHREEAPARPIRGVASREETEELLEEGIPVMPLPVPPQGEWH
jgi:hypothetical protein